MSKIVDVIANADEFSYSFEVTPDFIEDRLNDVEFEPTFFAVTWHATLYDYIDLDLPPIALAKKLIGRKKHVLLHLSCNKLKKEYMNRLLVNLQEVGICNLFVILGENYDREVSDFKSTQELISHIRKISGNYFCIGVAGFPERDEKLLHLKEKVDCGADFIITQAFFDTNVFSEFVNKCNNIGINIPILPGIFPYDTYKQLCNFTNICKVNVSDNIIQQIQHKIGLEVVANLVKNLKELNVKHFHFFTLNNIDKATTIIKVV